MGTTTTYKHNLFTKNKTYFVDILFILKSYRLGSNDEFSVEF